MTAFSDAQLSAYLDGEADLEATAAIDSALEQDPGLAERMADLGRNDLRLRDGVDERLGPIPSRLSDLITPDSPTSAVIAFPPRRAATMTVFRRILPWAAVLMVGVFAGVTFQSTRSRTLLIDSPSGPIAGPALAAALSSARAGMPTQVDGAKVRVAISFEARDGRLCRQFEATFQSIQATGIACHGDRIWRIDGWTTDGAPRSDGYRTAAGPDDPIISAELDRLGVVGLLDGPAESAAIDAGWKPRAGR